MNLHCGVQDSGIVEVFTEHDSRPKRLEPEWLVQLNAWGVFWIPLVVPLEPIIFTYPKVLHLLLRSRKHQFDAV